MSLPTQLVLRESCGCGAESEICPDRALASRVREASWKRSL